MPWRLVRAPSSMTSPPPFLVRVLVAMAALVGAVFGSGGGEAPSISCGSNNLLTSRHGIIQTPNFPLPPSTPLYCRWVIDASWVEERNVTVYLTQQYVLSGLRVYDYDNSSEHRLIYEHTNGFAIASEYVRSTEPYVAIELNLTTLVGNHLRVLKDLQEVYGFNITYEVTYKGELARVGCSPILCGFVGKCSASPDFKNYSCECPGNFSGPNCNLGPMCLENPCKNGGKCRSTGTESIVCKCQGDFTGVFCQYPPIEKEVRECKANGEKGCGDSSGSEVKPGRMLYTVKLLISDKDRPSSSWRYSCDKSNLTELLSIVTKKSLLDLKTKLQLALNLTVYNLSGQGGQSTIYDLVIVSMTLHGEMTFQFKTYENSSIVSVVLNNMLHNSSLQPFVRWSPETLEDDLIQKCMERQIYLSGDGMSVSHHPALYLRKFVPNNPKPMRPGRQQVFSCDVIGSSNVSFSWFKGSQRVIPRDRSRIWTDITWGPNNTVSSLLGVDNATPLDDGRWTCVVRDGQRQQSRSVDSYVLQPPSVRMLPPMITTPKGEKVFLSCILSHNGQVWRDELECSWTRNGVPLYSSGDHIIEPLDYPNGCLLRIQNINESATYTCHVKSEVGRASTAARVEVFLDDTTLCDPNDDWPAVPVDTVATIECPEGLLGSVAKRRCSAVNHPTSAGIISQWDYPDYSACVPTEAVHLVYHLKEISQGYAPSTPAQVLEELLFLINVRTSLRPRQGEALLTIALEAWEMSEDHLQIHYQMLQIVDLLLTFPRAIVSPKFISGISRVAKKAAMAKMELSQSTAPLDSLRSLSVSYFNVNQTSSVLQLQKYQPNWCAHLHFSSLGNRLSVPIVTLEFKTLKDIIPYNSRLNSSDIFYQILSSVAMTSLVETTDNNATRKHTSVEIIFENIFLNLSTLNDVPYWNMSCGYVKSNSFSGMQWDLGSCTTWISRVDERRTSRLWLPWARSKALVSVRSKVSVRCCCPVPGTYAVLLEGFTQKPEGEVSSVAVVLALWCCALEATVALILPFVDAWRERLLKTSQSQITAPSQVPSQTSSVAAGTSAKTAASEAIIFRAFHVTSCTNTALFSLIMALTMCKWNTSFPGVLLQCLLLLGISLPTAQLYLIAAELGAFSVFPVGLWPRQYIRSHAVTVALSIGPVVVFLVLWLSIRDLRATLSQCWTSWMEWGEPVSWALAIPSSIMAVAGLVMAAMSRRLATMANYNKRPLNDARCKRVFRLGVIVVCQLAFLLTTMIYTSAPGMASHVALLFASVLLGYSLLLCYVLQHDKQWQVLSVAWCSGEDLLDSVEHPQTPATSPANMAAPVPQDCQSRWRRLFDFFGRRKRRSPLQNVTGSSALSASATTPLESPDTLRPLIVSPAKMEPQINGVPKKATRFVFGSGSKPMEPLPSSSKPSDSYCLSSRSGELNRSGSAVPLRELETSPLKKINNYRYLTMRGRCTKVKCSPEAPVRRCEPEKTDTGKPVRSVNLAAQPSTSRPHYNFRRKFLGLGDFEESSSGS